MKAGKCAYIPSGLEEGKTLADIFHGMWGGSSL